MEKIMSNKKLYESLQEEFGKRGIEQIEIPFYIKENLSRELRIYQEKALKYYYANGESIKQRHIMFNMATGSGKTLIMAALMLDCYKKGYRNFIFFVNSTSILEKTKANFANKYSSKYLFKENINIDSKNVEINIINNFFESKDECINIYFTTIQALFSLFKNERENSLSFEDLKEQKLVFLADEAHHLNSNTKNKSENELKEGWETIIKKAYESNNDNLLFEFSATIPQEQNVLEKYQDKIIYEYTLKEFCKEGYSKRIFLMKYDSHNIQDRFLGGILSSLYRELLAIKNGISLKPVVLFKSDGITNSNKNQADFIKFIDSLDSHTISDFYKNINAKENELLARSLEFFKREYQDSYANIIVNFLKNNFKALYILNTNDDKELIKNQILLNNLEDINNQIRIIFAVDKLNEGWDVLNLFDIVRLGNNKSSKAVTTKEAQLIGRGARYYPMESTKLEFSLEDKYKRKFDNDIENELSILERLSYHTINEIQFIEELNKTMTEQGILVDSPKERIELIPNKELQHMTKNKIYYAKNKRVKKLEIQQQSNAREIKLKIEYISVPLFSNHIKEDEEKFKQKLQENDLQKIESLKNIETKYFLKAMNMLDINFKDLKKDFNFNSKRDFIENYLQNIRVSFSKKQEFSVENNLNIAKFIIENFKTIKQMIKQEYEVDDFRCQVLNLNKRIIFKNKREMKDSIYTWLYYDKYSIDSNLEQEFLNFIESEKEIINKAFKEWFIIRNDGFEEFKIFDNRKDEPTYGFGFEPDFILFGKKIDSNDDFISIQCFIETKGELLKENDAWKEEFLMMIKNQQIEINDKTEIQSTLTIDSLPFFISQKGQNNNFINDFMIFCNHKQ